MDLQAYWNAVLGQQPQALRAFFHPEAHVDWPNTGERFTLEEFIRANCEYPGEWDGEIRRVVQKDDLTVTVVSVFSKDKKLSFHVTSFMRIREGRLLSLEEYWGDDGPPPRWRQEMKIGSPIPE